VLEETMKRFCLPALPLSLALSLAAGRWKDCRLIRNFFSLRKATEPGKRWTGLGTRLANMCAS